MVYDVFGQVLQCFQEMLKDFIAQNFLLKVGQKVKWMVNYLLEEVDFHRQFLW
jgi:hypothetical protein